MELCQLSTVAAGGVGPPYDAKAVANLILDWCDLQGISVTPLKLQKLLYFCHADFLSTTNISLIIQDFEAWDYGPVIPCIYEEFKAEGRAAIQRRALKFDPVSLKRTVVQSAFLRTETDLMRQIFEIYKNFTAEQLSDMSHVLDGPWKEARRLFAIGRNMDRRMSASLIALFHRGLFSEN